MDRSRGNGLKCPRTRMLKKDAALCISDLPDAMLLHILSFLPTKSVVATSLLSRRWHYLWTSTPNLQLDESLFRKRSEFMNFAERALLLRGGSSLVSFYLFCNVRKGGSRISTLITSAIRYNVEQLSLNLRELGSFVLPFCLFQCQSLVKLVLTSVMSTNRVPSMICLPRLKHLEITSVRFEDNESAQKLLSHPQLEELIISYCTWNVTAVNVNSPMLQSLSIDDVDYGKKNGSEQPQVCFIGDNLKFFRYYGMGDLPFTQYCICGSTMQLREAELLVPDRGRRVQDKDVLSNRYCKLVNNLSMVQNLTLSDGAVHILYLLSQCPRIRTTFPVFERLTRLNLGAYNDQGMIDYVWLRMIFKRCPHLEHLNFMQVIFYSSTGDLPLLRPMHTHLKKITLQSYHPKWGTQDDLIHVLLNSAPVLEEIVLHCKRYGGISGEDSKVAELEREFNTCPKVSENCRVSIVLV